MSECPNQECHDRVVKLESLKADKTCLAKYLKKPSVVVIVAFLTVVVIPMLLTGVKVWSGQEISPHIYAKKEDAQKTRERVVSLEENVKAIRRDITRDITILDRSVRDQKEEMNRRFDKMEELIKRAFRPRHGG